MKDKERKQTVRRGNVRNSSEAPLLLPEQIKPLWGEMSSQMDLHTGVSVRVDHLSKKKRPVRNHFHTSDWLWSQADNTEEETGSRAPTIRSEGYRDEWGWKRNLSRFSCRETCSCLMTLQKLSIFLTTSFFFFSKPAQLCAVHRNFSEEKIWERQIKDLEKMNAGQC